METWHRIQAGLGGWGLLVLALLVIFFLVRVVWFVRRRQRRERRRAAGAALAASLGWEYRLGDLGWVEFDHWRGTLHGVAWELEARAPAPHAPRRWRRRYTRWRTADLTLPEGFVAVMPFPADDQARAGVTFPLGQGGSGPGSTRAQRATAFFLRHYFSATFDVEGKEVLGEDLAGISRWAPPELAATWTAFSSDEQLARAVLAPPVDGLFLKWLEHVAEAAPGGAGIPAVLFWREGLALGFPAAVQSDEELQRVVALGAAICALGRERGGWSAAPGTA